MDELENDFQKNVKIGRKLHLYETMILQRLTDGLKPEYQNILIVNLPTNTTEWYRIVKQLVVAPTLTTTPTKKITRS